MGFRDTRWRRVAPTQWRSQPVARPLPTPEISLVCLSCGDAYDNQVTELKKNKKNRLNFFDRNKKSDDAARR